MQTINPPTMTVANVAALYLQHTKNEQHTRTFESRKRHLDAFVKEHGQLAIKDAKPFHLKFWLDSQTQWKSDWTRKGVVSSIQHCFNWAARLGVITGNPFKGVRQREGRNGRAMTDVEFGRMLRVSSVLFRRVLIFLRYTGCRPGEMAQVRLDYIDRERGIITLWKHKTIHVDQKPRVVVMHPVVRRLIDYVDRSRFPNQITLFVNARGRAWNRHSISHRIQRIRDRAGIPNDCKIYGLRHAFGTNAIRKKVGIKTVAVLMGHKTTRSTERYIHIENDIEHLADALNATFGSK